MIADDFDPYTATGEEAVEHAKALLAQVQAEWEDVHEIARQLRDSRPRDWPV